MKSEHIIWAYADHKDGGKVLLIGLTDLGIDFMRREKKTLLANPPENLFQHVRQVVVFHEKDKATMKRMLKGAGIVTIDLAEDMN